ncbi:Rap1a/Tai family immunity protein [Pseudomonas sp. URMO17WK12:I12]|jgi:hypothetical protein|uniref:Rap1a/Tai family immunity protein n=1 Tax=Pseudomonas sp. URMO17WK12:I12 TaxID=1259797 RepID=UPI000486C4C0|nr:Rap1a/Tai family immunity protein [Pseudomonas sp. URMO17WK12:I12]
MKAQLMAVALFGVLGCGTAMAAGSTNDGNLLLGQCQQYIKSADPESNYNRADAGMCIGYLQGVQNTFDFLNDEIKSGTRLCIPENVTNGQMARIVVRFLEDNPRLLNGGRTGLVWLAIKDAFPCK